MKTGISTNIVWHFEDILMKIKQNLSKGSDDIDGKVIFSHKMPPL